MNALWILRTHSGSAVMSLAHWLKARRWLPRKASRTSSIHRSRLRLEELEKRSVPSVSVYRADLPHPQPIPDLCTTTSTLEVPESVVIGDVNVTLNLVHSRASDLDVFLIAPDGTRIELLSGVAFPRTGKKTPFRPLTLDDEADVSVQDVRAQFAGSFRPE